jgi:hypothetical protein
MNKRLLCFFAILTLFPTLSQAQDARGMAIGYAATAAPLGIFGIYWNPALEAIPGGVGAWTIASGFSAFDTSNINSPILRFNPANSIQSGSNPVLHYQDYSGLFGVQYGTLSFGAIYDQNLNTNASQDSLSLLNNPVSAGKTYSLGYLNTLQQIETFIVSYAMPLPLGAFQFLSIGGSLKYHYGIYYNQTSLTGAYTQGSTDTTTYQYTSISSNSGLGLSMDLGLFAKVSDMLNVGFMMQNIQSSYNWQAQQQNYTLDSNTGQTILSGAASSVTVSQPFPYTTKLGIAIAPPDKNTYLEGEVSWVSQATQVNAATHWRIGLERYYPAGIVIRLGTFADDISGQELWTLGIGYFRSNFCVDLSGITRSIPDLENSISLGGAIDAAIRF